MDTIYASSCNTDAQSNLSKAQKYTAVSWQCLSQQSRTARPGRCFQ